jgi:hypothetical protein
MSFSSFFYPFQGIGIEEKEALTNEEEKSAKYLIIYTGALDFRGFELQNFIEERTNSNVEDISVFTYENGAHIGISAVVFAEPIPISVISKIQESLFFGVGLRLRAFPKYSEFQKFMNIHAVERLERIGFTQIQSVPLVYIEGYDGTREELNEQLELFGNINLIRVQEAQIRVFIVYFDKEASALNACRVLNGASLKGSIVVVKPLFRRAVTQYFAVRGLEAANEVEELCSVYGKISAIKTVQERDSNTFYVFMENLEEAITACTLLSGRKYSDSNSTTTFFITKDRFMKT